MNYIMKRKKKVKVRKHLRKLPSGRKTVVKRHNRILNRGPVLKKLVKREIPIEFQTLISELAKQDCEWHISLDYEDGIKEYILPKGMEMDSDAFDKYLEHKSDESYLDEVHILSGLLGMIIFDDDSEIEIHTHPKGPPIPSNQDLIGITNGKAYIIFNSKETDLDFPNILYYYIHDNDLFESKIVQKEYKGAPVDKKLPWIVLAARIAETETREKFLPPLSILKKDDFFNDFSRIYLQSEDLFTSLNKDEQKSFMKKYWKQYYFNLKKELSKGGITMGVVTSGPISVMTKPDLIENKRYRKKKRKRQDKATKLSEYSLKSTLSKVQSE